MKRMFLTVLLAASGFLSGCGDPQLVDDCTSLCNRYASCFNSGYDVNTCESKCEDSKSSGNEANAKSCSDCMSDNSCAGTVITCDSSCSGFIP